MNGLNGMRFGTIAAVLLALCVFGPAAYGAPVELANGVPATGLSGDGGSQTFYVINVPAGQDQLEISISGGTGDCDLYVRHGSEPTLTSYDYRPYLVGNEESVSIATPAEGAWYIMLRGYTSYADLTLTATYSAANVVNTLTNGVPVTGLTGAQGTELYFKIDVPSGPSELEISITGGTGDCDLYVKYGALPTTSDYDYRPFALGNEETVTVENPTEGTWYIMLKAYDAYAGVTLQAAHDGGDGLLLQNGIPVDASGVQGSQTLYRIEVPSGQDDLTISISGGTGDCDLYVKQDAAPTLSDYDYRPYLSGNDETVDVASPAAGTWYIMLHGYNAYTGATLVATYSGVTATELEKNVPVTDLAGSDGSEDYYQVKVPSGQIGLEISISGGDGNCDLYVKFGAMPTTSDWDYRPNTSGNNETVTVDNPQAGTWYIMLKAPKGYSGVTLLADYWAGTGVTTLDNGIPVPGITGDQGSEQFYVISVPAGQDTLVISTTGGTGDADLYVKLGDVPTVGDYDYRPYLIGNEEEVTIENPAEGDWYIMVRGYAAFDNVTLTATYESEGTQGPTVLTSGVPVPDLAGAAYSETFFMIDVPANQLELDVALSGGSGDADLYIRKGDLPTVSEWDYRPYLIGNDESVTIDHPEAGTYYIMIRGYTNYAGAALVATLVPEETVVELTNGVPVADISGEATSQLMYTIEVPADQNYVDISITGGTGNCDLYVKVGSEPSPSSWDYRPYLDGNEETVYAEKPTAGTWYVMLRGRTAYEGVTLKATYGLFGIGNNFADDPNCVALWTFEKDTFNKDLVGTNNLTNAGTSVQLEDFKEGAGCADFEEAQHDYMYIEDADLVDDFPTKSTDQAGFKMSMCFWMKMESRGWLPTIISKYMTISNDRSWRFWVDYDALNLSLGYIGGSDFNRYLIDDDEQPLQLDRWYHVAFTYDDTDLSFHVRIWDDTAGALRYDLKTHALRHMALTKAPLVFGNVLLQSWYFDGLLDEVVVFKDILTDAEIDQIRQGAYMNPIPGTDSEPGSKSAK